MDSPRPPDFSNFIAKLSRELRLRELPFMLIGGQAVLLHGRPRLTEDIDITLGVDPSRLSAVREACAALGLAPLPERVEEFVRDTFVLPVHDDTTGIRVDFIFSTTPYERQAIERAVIVKLAGEAVPFASAEDLVIHKLFAGRARDLEDVTTVIQRQRTEIDWTYLAKWAREFASVPGRESMPEQVSRLRREQGETS
jgi:predicted nucleotidyltransferase